MKGKSKASKQDDTKKIQAPKMNVNGMANLRDAIMGNKRGKK